MVCHRQLEREGKPFTGECEECGLGPCIMRENETVIISNNIVGEIRPFPKPRENMSEDQLVLSALFQVCDALDNINSDGKIPVEDLNLIHLTLRQIEYLHKSGA